ncbi:MAG: hypothetical protein AMXMBFR48_04220 [Ignavibacteriales bacterium]
MIKKIKGIVFKGLIPFLKMFKVIEWHIYKNRHDKIKIVVGAGVTKFPGWLQTDIWHLNLTKEDDFKRIFGSRKIDSILAEHVLEHLTEAEILAMLHNIRLYASGSFKMRIAVPDGYHGDDKYIQAVRPGGSGEGSDDHKHLFTYLSMQELFAKEGFKGHPVEYWDEHKVFHKGYQNDENGYISRSFINDERNADGNPRYTSLIIDFTLR